LVRYDFVLFESVETEGGRDAWTVVGQETLVGLLENEIGISYLFYSHSVCRTT
jgi:hypothetical protein